MKTENLKYIAIVGPTASGKSALAIEIALKVNGEIICADSRTIYRHMSIGTAKPSEADREKVRHHLLDIAEPGARLSAAEFKRLALITIANIHSRGKIPLLVGGSGLYVDSVIYDYQFPPQPNEQIREQLEKLSDDELQGMLQNRDADSFSKIDITNRRRLIRALETVGMKQSKRSNQLDSVLTLGIDVSKEVIQKRITERINKMLSEGFIDEVAYIGTTYGWDSDAMNIIGYRAFKGYFTGEKTISEAAEQFAMADLRLVKKQRTWFKRNSAINWITDEDEAMSLVTKFLNL